MSINAILIIVGAVLIIVGLAKAGQSGGFGLRNFGMNFGGTTTGRTRSATLRRSRKGPSPTGLGSPLLQLDW